VTLTNKESAREYKTTTDNSGSYIFRQIEPGRYTLLFEQAGFTKAEVADALIVVGQQIKIDMQLTVGATLTAIVVSESAPLIDTVGVTRSNNINAEEFNNLPKSRSFQSLALLAPSVNRGQIEGGFQASSVGIVGLPPDSPISRRALPPRPAPRTLTSISPLAPTSK